MYEAGLITLLATIILLWKLPRSWVLRILWLDVPVDILVTASFVITLHGTYSGLMAALVAGLGFSVVLGLAKKLMGYERLQWDPSTRRYSWSYIQGWI